MRFSFLPLTIFSPCPLNVGWAVSAMPWRVSSERLWKPGRIVQAMLPTSRGRSPRHWETLGRGYSGKCRLSLTEGPYASLANAVG